MQGTFVIPKLYVDSETKLGNHVSQTGVGPYNPETDEIALKAYYQWVPFMLFLQCIMFYIPHIVYEIAEGHKVKRIIGSLHLFVLDREKRKEAEGDLATYFVESMGIHDTWSIQVLFAHCLYLVNVIGQMFFTNCFLGGEFAKYGLTTVLEMMESDELRIDPMSQVFPRVTKCTFHKYVASIITITSVIIVVISGTVLAVLFKDTTSNVSSPSTSSTRRSTSSSGSGWSSSLSSPSLTSPGILSSSPSEGCAGRFSTGS